MRAANRMFKIPFSKVSVKTQHYLFRWEKHSKPQISILKKSINTIGRDKSNDIVVNDHSVSRKHAIIFLHSESMIYIDLRSTLGSRINGKNIENGYNNPDNKNKNTVMFSSPISTGDVITVGRIDLIVT